MYTVAIPFFLCHRTTTFCYDLFLVAKHTPHIHLGNSLGILWHCSYPKVTKSWRITILLPLCCPVVSLVPRGVAALDSAAQRPAAHGKAAGRAPDSARRLSPPLPSAMPQTTKVRACLMPPAVARYRHPDAPSLSCPDCGGRNIKKLGPLGLLGSCYGVRPRGLFSLLGALLLALHEMPLLHAPEFAAEFLACAPVGGCALAHDARQVGGDL